MHALPALEALRAALPHAWIAWAVEPRAQAVLTGHPCLDAVVPLDRAAAFGGDKGRGVRARTGGMAALGGSLATLRRMRLDAAIDLHGLLRSALVARFSGARRVLGPAWAREGAPLFYTDRLRVPRPGEAHVVERHLESVRAALARLGVPASEPSWRGAAHATAPVERPLLSIALAERGPARRGPSGGGGGGGGGGDDDYDHDHEHGHGHDVAASVVVLPGAGKAANRLPAAWLAEVCDGLARALGPSAPIAVLGGPEDREAAAALAGACQVAKPVALAGTLDLRGSMRWLARARVVIGGDTGPLHLARALGAPVVGVFHAADPQRTGPAGLPGPAPFRVLTASVPCAPCIARRCQRPDRHRICLDAIAPDRVVAAALEAMT